MVVVDKVDGGGTMWGPVRGTFVFSGGGKDMDEYQVGNTGRFPCADRWHVGTLMQNSLAGITTRCHFFPPVIDTIIL